jgi:L-fuconolactonase
MTRRIDAHHHVWDLTVRDQPWMVADTMAPIRRSFTIDEFVAEATRNGVAASVVVQTVSDVRETEELLDMAADIPLVAGVVGWVDLASPDVGDRLDELLARPSGSSLSGVRSPFQYEPDPDWLRRPPVIAGLREVARRDLVNEMLVVPHQLTEVVTVLGEVPEGRFVLDHLAKPDIASMSWEPWATDLAAVSKRENIVAKFSGLVTEADWSNWDVADVRRYFDHALASFGTERIVFGTDWPVCTLAASYQRIVDLAEQLTVGLSPDELAAIFGGNATKVYALGDRGTEETS